MVSSIKVCMGSSCFARGNTKNLQLIQQYLIDNNLDTKIELTGLRCCDRCAKGPNLTIDDIEYNNIDTGTLLDILEKHFNNSEPTNVE